MIDEDAKYRAVQSRDRRFDGVFYLGVRTTGIYCRPSCPARTPHRRNVSFFASAAAAQTDGFRACRRCLPDATPGSPEWDVKADLAGRAMRLISDGVVEREGVGGLATRLGYSERQVERTLTAELGAGPLALARARRAQTARTLIESTSLSFSEAAFASGFSSIRQFNSTIREVYDATPSRLRRRPPTADPGSITLRIGVRGPFAGASLVGFLAARTIAGVETATGATYSRTLRLPHGYGAVTLDVPGFVPAGEVGFVGCRVHLQDMRDLAVAIERSRRLLDADADPAAVDAALGADPALAPLVAARPGLRVPGQVDGFEVAVRAIVGQQVTVAGARRIAEGMASTYGEPWPECPVEGLGTVFPDPAALTSLQAGALPMPAARIAALAGLARAVDSGDVALDRSRDRADVRGSLLALAGVGPWTADYIALRALADPDVFLAGDAGVKTALARLAPGEDGARWSPWRSYAVMHLWTWLATEAANGRATAEGED